MRQGLSENWKTRAWLYAPDTGFTAKTHGALEPAMFVINRPSRYILQPYEKGESRSWLITESIDEEGTKIIATAASEELGQAILDILDPPMTLDALGYIAVAQEILSGALDGTLIQVDAHCGATEIVPGGAWVPCRIFIAEEEES